MTMRRSRLFLLVSCLPLLIAGCSHSKVLSLESALLSQPVLNMTAPSLNVSNEAVHPSQAIDQNTDPSVVLIASPDTKSKSMDCGVVEVDEKTGLPILPADDNEKKKGGKHWPCQKVANGQGGYRCNALTQGKFGCNNCPSCSCQTIGSGAGQNCLCQ